MTAQEQQRHQDEELPVTKPFKRRTARMHQSLIDAVSSPYIRSLRERIDSRETRTQGFDDEWGREFDITIEDPTEGEMDKDLDLVITVRARDITEALIFAAVDRLAHTSADVAPEDDYEREA